MQLVCLQSLLATCCAKSCGPLFLVPSCMASETEHSPSFPLALPRAHPHSLLSVLNVHVLLPRAFPVFACFLRLWFNWSLSVLAVLCWSPGLYLKLKLRIWSLLCIPVYCPVGCHARIVHGRFNFNTSSSLTFSFCHPQSPQERAVFHFFAGALVVFLSVLTDFFISFKRLETSSN